MHKIIMSSPVNIRYLMLLAIIDTNMFSDYYTYCCCCFAVTLAKLFTVEHAYLFVFDHPKHALAVDLSPHPVPKSARDPWRGSPTWFAAFLGSSATKTP